MTPDSQRALENALMLIRNYFPVVLPDDPDQAVPLALSHFDAIESIARAALGGLGRERDGEDFTQADLRMLDEWAKFTYAESAGYWGAAQEKVRDKLRAALAPGSGQAEEYPGFD